MHSVDWDQSRGEIGIWLSPQVRGRGLAPRALKLAGEWLLGACGLARVELLVEPGNAPMMRTADAARFVSEGTLREYVRKRGKGVDVVMVSLIPGDL